MSVLAKTDSEASSLTGNSSPPRSPGRPGRPVYFVQSPSHDGETKTSNSFPSSPAQSPMGSPPHSHSNSSLGPTSRDSSSTRFSGSSRPKHAAQRGSCGSHRKGWRPWKEAFDAIEEEGLLDDDAAAGATRRWYVAVFVVGFLSLFSLFSLILFAASRPQKPVITMKSILFDQFVVQAGTDFSGVATEMVSMNSTVKLTFRNTATFFGVHVTSTPIDLSYSRLTVATGTMSKFYQSRKSHRSIVITLRGSHIPLYGGGASLGSSNGAPAEPVDLTLRFMVRSRAYVLGKLVKPKFYRTVECSVTMHPKTMSKPIALKNKCTYK